MGRHSSTGGVCARGINRIQYDFRLSGIRYRPALKAIPTEANLRRARALKGHQGAHSPKDYLAIQDLEQEDLQQQD
jgi:Arm DNA-binding domain